MKKATVLRKLENYTIEHNKNIISILILTLFYYCFNYFKVFPAFIKKKKVFF